jgi:hypothetical protein
VTTTELSNQAKKYTSYEVIWSVRLISLMEMFSFQCASHAIIEEIKTGSYLLSVQYLWMLSCNLPYAYRQSTGVSVVGTPVEDSSWNKLVMSLIHLGEQVPN